MKKIVTFSLAAVFAAGSAVAQDDIVMVDQPGSAAETEVTAEVALVSAYVWRGQVLNNDASIQPQISISHEGFSANIWANYGFSGDTAGVSDDISEFDLSLAYTLPAYFEDVAIDVGMINYQFPANGKVATESTTELFVSATFLALQDYIIPSITLFGDVNEVDGTYLLFDLAAPLQVSDVMSVEGGVSAGYGDAAYNSHYYNGSEKGFGDYNLYGTAAYELAENLTVSANATYTFLEGGQIREAAKDNFESKQKLWFGVNLAYDF